MRNALVLWMVLCGCGGSNPMGAGGAGGSGGSGGSGGTGGTGGGAAPTSGSANGFSWAFAPDSVAFDCADPLAQILAKNPPHITMGSTTVLVGMEQVSGTDQDPIVARFDGDNKVFCEHSKKGGGVDGRAYGLTWNGADKLYVVYTIVGGGTLFDSAAQGGWLSTYGDGGASAKVTVIGAVDTQVGVVQHATFVSAKLVKNGQKKTNTLLPADAIHVLSDGNLEFLGKPSWCTLNPDQSLMCDTTSSADYPQNYRAHFSPDLKTMLCASADGVSKVSQPCP